jgi:hypothetical protein
MMANAISSQFPSAPCRTGVLSEAATFSKAAALSEAAT